MDPKKIQLFLIVCLATFGVMLGSNLPDGPGQGHLLIKITLLFGLSMGSYYMAFPAASRFISGMALAAFLDLVFSSQDLKVGPIPLFWWGAIFMLLLISLSWLEHESNVPPQMVNLSLLALLFLGIPTLILFQLNPLLQEVYSQPLWVSLRNFLPIPLCLLTFILGFNLKRGTLVIPALFLALALSAVRSAIQ
jgi:hypothetical protein